jgi:hypothetical protein
MRAHAARNNAEWCDIVSRSHGLTARFDDNAWTCPTRTPPLYPDAVTLVPDVSVPDLLARIDAGAGCSIKDSFASIDLEPHGFRVLFEAAWITRPGSAEPLGAAPWRRVTTTEDFAAWEAAWRGDDGPEGVLLAQLLEEASVEILASCAQDRVVGGALLNRTGAVVGISNFFTRSPDRDEADWNGCIARAEALNPGATLVGYAARTPSGFTPAGPLRVWIKDE